MILRGPGLLTLLAAIVALSESDQRDLIVVVFIVLLCLAINAGSKSNGQGDE